MKHRRKSGSTGGDFISGDSVDGYIVDQHGKIVGEARNYDPYSRFGDMMLYDVDIFGYLWGYISIDWHVMSEEDIRQDKVLARRLYEAKYQSWKRNNITDLYDSYAKKPRYKGSFEKFCRELFHSSQ